LAISAHSVVPLYTAIGTTVSTRMPGSKNCTYSPTDPAMAPPKRNVKMSSMTIGDKTASIANPMPLLPR